MWIRLDPDPHHWKKGSDLPTFQKYLTVITSNTLCTNKLVTNITLSSRNAGKSKMFQVLCKKYVGERVYDPPPEPETTDAKAEDENKEERREENKKGENTAASESMSKEEVKESKHEESKDTD